MAFTDISAAIFALTKSLTDRSDDDIMSQIRNYHEHQNVDWGKPAIAKRIQALEAFMTSDIYTPGGRPIGEIDDEVSKLFSLF